MFFRIKKIGQYEYIMIVENKWVNGKSKQKVIHNLGRVEKVLESEQLDSLLISGAKLSKKVAVLAEYKRSETPTSKRKIVGPSLVFEKLWKEMGIDKEIKALVQGRKYKFDMERAVFLTVLHRLMKSGPDSQCDQWRIHYRVDGTEDLQLHHLYRAMAWLGEPTEDWNEEDPLSSRRTYHHLEERLFQKTRDLFSSLQMVFMDTTSLYFEGEGGEGFGERGKTKDHRPDCKQMVIGVVLDDEGKPICSEMWPGSTTDVTILEPIVERLKHRFHIQSVCVVCDRGMTSDANIEELEAKGFHYILGARMRNSKEVRDEVLGRGGRYETVRPGRTKRTDPSPLEVKNVEVNGHRYVICRNPEEAESDAAKREAILSALEKALKKGQKKLIGNKGYRKYVKMAGKVMAIDREKVSNESRYDGKYVLRTDLDIPASEIALKYKQLWMVERLFREMKSSLETRPVYHKYDATIRGHVFCSFLALKLLKRLSELMLSKGYKLNLGDLRRNLNEVYEDEISFESKRYMIRSEVPAAASCAMRSAGVRFPPFIRQLIQ